MNKRTFLILIIGLALAVATLPMARDLADAGPGTNATGAAATPSGGTFYANSPIITKFVDSLPGLGPANANNLGQYITVAVPDTTTFPGCDYYEIALVEYREQMHSDLPKVVGSKTTGTGGALLRGYMQEMGGVALSDPHYMGPLIMATKGRPVRIKFRNALPTGTEGNLFLPVDVTLTGAGMGPLTSGGATCDPTALGATCASYTQNRASIHLEGGYNPWISAGTSHQWVAPAAETTPYTKGASVKNVPDMWFDATTHAVIPGASLTAPNLNATNDPGPGAMTYYFPNAQSARLLFYHDNSYGNTRLNVYAGEAAGYLITDTVEQGLVNSGVIPSTQIPLFIQDKSFVPTDISVQDTKWDTTKWGTYGSLWFPHVYETNQWPGNPDGSGLNPFGRYDYGPWFWPVFPVAADKAGIYTSASSIVAEAYLDTPVINGTAYPYLNVDPKTYRFRIRNSSDDRYLNMGIYYADPNVANGSEVKMIAADPRLPNELAADFGAGTMLYNGDWSALDKRSVTNMAYAVGAATLYVNLGTNGVWQYDGVTWTQISATQAARMVASDMKLYVDFGVWGLWQWDGSSFTQIDSKLPNTMVASSSALYAYYTGSGLYKYDGTSWSRISTTPMTSMIASGSNLYVDFGMWGLWQYDGTSFIQINTSSPQDMVTSSAALFANYGKWGLFKYDGTSWTQITPNQPGKMAASSWGLDLFAQFGASGLWRYDNTGWTQIDTKLPDNMVAGSALYLEYGQWGLWKYASGKFTQISSTNPNVLQPVNFMTAPNWPTDGRDGGVPDPTTVGPQMVQIGNDGGLLPQPAVIPNQPVDYIYFRRIITVLNVKNHALFLAPGEAADVIVDFSKVPAGSRLILYNDAPAPAPQTFDPRYDYYTGDPDQTALGGAPTTKAGVGPNTRTIMQFRVSNATPAAAFNLPALKSALPVAYAQAQKMPIVAQSVYNAAYLTDYTDTYATIKTGSSTQPTFDFTAGSWFSYVPMGSATLTTAMPGQAVQLPIKDKAIVEEADSYGRMYFQLGTELPFTNFTIQTTLPFNYLDPASESLYPGEVQIWKITHNGVVTHPLSIDSMEMQIINRVAWDGTVAPIDPEEAGWKSLVRVNPLETAFIAVRATIPPTPATMGTLAHSNRLLDPTMPVNTTAQFMNIDPLTGSAVVPAVSNILTDFGYEYEWGDLQLSHRDNNSIRPIILKVP